MMLSRVLLMIASSEDSTMATNRFRISSASNVRFNFSLLVTWSSESILLLIISQTLMAGVANDFVCSFGNNLEYGDHATSDVILGKGAMLHWAAKLLSEASSLS